MNGNHSTESVKMAAGGGNATTPLTAFLPQEVRIKTGESVAWYNPTEVGEHHNKPEIPNIERLVPILWGHLKVLCLLWRCSHSLE